MQHATISDYLAQLAAREPTPGGGAVAALHAAQAASLLAMVARYSDGPKYAADAAVIASVLSEADQIRTDSLELADADAAAFGAVTAAYTLPRGTDDERAARSMAISAALVAAAGPPSVVIAIGNRLIDLCEQLVPVGNRNVITDVAAAADASCAALSTGRLNVEINLAGIKDETVTAQLRGHLAGVDECIRRGMALTERVRAMIA